MIQLRNRPGLGFIVVIFLIAVVTLTSVVSAQEIESSAEPWKGTPPDKEIHVGALAGLGIIDTTPGFALIGMASKKILSEGWIPDINDQVFIEAEIGPMFNSGHTYWIFSGHLRWDFVRDDQWTFFALGGLGGNITGASLGDRAAVFPRIGVGAFYRVADNLLIRGELSHELIAAGVSFPF